MPNYLSIIWLIMCLKMSFIDYFPSLYSFVDYLIMGISFIHFFKITGLKRVIIDKNLLFPLFLLLSFIQVIGLIQVCNSFSIKNVFTTICIAIFIYNFVTYENDIQIRYIRVSFYLMLFFVSINSYRGILLDNTSAGAMIFMTCGYAVIELINNSEYEYIGYLSAVLEWRNVILAIVVSLITTYIAGARTSLLVLLLIIMCVVILIVLKPDQKFINGFYWPFMLIVLGGIFFYINIRSFSWYDKVNAYSNLYFGKNIDSSRSYLWQTSLESLEWWQNIIGKGTGTLPEIERYRNSSFHNSFIQLYMQNGMIGLIILLCILKRIWGSISFTISKFPGKLIFAFLLGVIIYNCFECTLIQNKVFLGMIQWFVLSLGVRYSNK